MIIRMTDFKWFAERRIKAIRNIHAVLFTWLNSVLFIIPALSTNGAFIMDTKPKLLKMYGDIWKLADGVVNYADAVDWFTQEQEAFLLTARCVRVLSHPVYAATIRAGLSTTHAVKQETEWKNVIGAVEFYHRQPVKKWYKMSMELPGCNVELLAKSPTTGFALYCFHMLRNQQPVNAIVERSKDQVLGAGDIPATECLGTRGQVGVAVDMEICSVLKLPICATTADIVNELCRVYNVTFWYLPTFTNEYSLKAYLDAEYIREQKLDVGLNSGVNNRFIKRYSIRRLDGTNPVYDVVPVDSAKPNITIQCVGEHIRLMGVGGDWLARGRPVLSGRAAAYNDKITACVLDRGIQTAHRALINTYEAAMAAPKMAASIRGEFVAMMMAAAEPMITELTHNALYKVFTSSDTINVFSGVLRNKLRIYKTTRGSVEQAVTWLINTDLMLAKFRREYNVVCYEMFSSDVSSDSMTAVSRKKTILQTLTVLFTNVSVVLDAKPASLEEFEANLKTTALTTDL